MKNEEFLVKERLYKIEEMVSETFIRINKGCLINIGKIQRFETRLGCSIKVVMKNNFTEYVSRRELKEVKRRLGM